MALPMRDELLAQLEQEPAASGSTSVLHECPICYEDIESSFATSCNHVFCRACLKHWLCTSTTCPNCRAVLCRALTSRADRFAFELARTMDQRGPYRHYRTVIRASSPQRSQYLLRRDNEDAAAIAETRARQERRAPGFFAEVMPSRSRSRSRSRDRFIARVARQESGARRLEEMYQTMMMQQSIAEPRPGVAEEEGRDFVDAQAQGEESS